METDRQIDISEAIELGAADGTFYSRYFFPTTFRQQSPEFHKDMWAQLDDRSSRLKAFKCYREAAKTTIARTFATRRIAYGESRTVLFIGKSEAAARRSVRWLMKQVLFNRLWSSAFSITKGAKWNEELIEIHNGLFDHTVSVLPFGMTGSIRGVNLDDFRPDLIIVDDPCDSENTATPEARRKTSELFFADIVRTLVPASENPDAQILLLQTPLHQEDLIESASRDPAWNVATYSCFDEQGESRWPARRSTKDLLEEKESYVRRNQLSLWMREMECKIVSSELAVFKSEWLRFWEVLPDDMIYVLAIDPASSESKTADDTAMVVVGFHRNKIYLVEEKTYRGYEFDHFAADFINLLRAYKPRKVCVESIAYQRTLSWHLKQAMLRYGTYAPIDEVSDRRKKADRIIQALAGPASYGHVLCRPTHLKFVQQFTDYGPTANIHDDVLDAVAMAVTSSTYLSFNDVAIDGEFDRIDDEEKNIPTLDYHRAAP